MKIDYYLVIYFYFIIQGGIFLYSDCYFDLYGLTFHVMLISTKKSSQIILIPSIEFLDKSSIFVLDQSSVYAVMEIEPIHIYVYGYTYIYTYTYAHIYKHIYVCTYIYIHIYEFIF